MPRATANTEDTVEYDLRSLEGGKIELRRMTYGQLLARQELAMQLEVESQQGRGREAKISIQAANAAVAAFEFRHCVVSHNLEDENGQILNLAIEANVLRLDPRIGDEIGTLINNLNQFDPEGN